MWEYADLFIDKFADAPGYPGCRIAFAKFNSIPFGILVNEEHGTGGVFPLDEESEKIVEQKVVPWLEAISYAVYQKLSISKR